MSHITVEVPPWSRKQIRDLARRFRKHIRCEEPYFPIVDVIEFVLPKLQHDFEFIVEDMDEMGADHGRTYPDSSEIIVRADVYEGACKGNGRDRMTMAHELGHFLMHRDLPLNRRVERESIPSYRSSEWQANCFGGELLVAAEHAHLCKNSEEAAGLFGVSQLAAEYQWEKYQKEKII